MEHVLGDSRRNVSTRLIGRLNGQDVFDRGRSGRRWPQQQKAIEHGECLEN